MSKSRQTAIRLSPADLEQFKYHVQERQAAREVMEQAQAQMNAAQDLWRVASGGLESYVQFISKRYKLPQGQFAIDQKTGIVTNGGPQQQPTNTQVGDVDLSDLPEEEREAFAAAQANRENGE